VPYRAGVLQDWPDDGAVETQQVVLSSARPFQLLEEVQSRGRLRCDGIDMLRPLQVARDMHSLVNIGPQTVKNSTVHRSN